MDLQQYIDSGVLYDYCTGALDPVRMAEVEMNGLLYPRLQKEIDALKAMLHAGPSPASLVHLKEDIWGLLDNINKENAGLLNDLPLINKYSDYHKWKKIVQPLVPLPIADDWIVYPLRTSQTLTQLLIVSRIDVPEEIHDSEHECFLILDGECVCRLGEQSVHLGPGGFLEIPLFVPHSVHIISTQVTAVLQRRVIA